MAELFFFIIIIWILIDLIEEIWEIFNSQRETFFKAPLWETPG